MVPRARGLVAKALGLGRGLEALGGLGGWGPEALGGRGLRGLEAWRRWDGRTFIKFVRLFIRMDVWTDGRKFSPTVL